MVTRDEALAKLAALNEALARHNCEPVFTPGVTAAMSGRGLKAALKITEEELVRVTTAVLEQ